MATFDDLRAQKQDFFKKQRDQATQESNRMAQEAGDAMTRRFAALGSQGSGAAIGAQLKVKDAAESQRQKALEGIAGQELQANMADQEAAAQREFQSKEAQAGRDFQKNLTESESKAQRDFQREMSDKDLGFKREMFDFEKGTKLSELDMAKKQFDLDAETTDFNKRLALAIQGIQRFDKPIQDMIPSAFDKDSSQPTAISASQPQIMSNQPRATAIFGTVGKGGVNMDMIAKDRFGNVFGDLPPESQKLVQSIAATYARYWGNRNTPYGRGMRSTEKQVEEARKYII